MRLQHKEQETTDIDRTLAREPDTQGYVPVEQESTVVKGEFATNTPQRSTRYNVVEAFCVAACLPVLEVFFHLMTRNLTSVAVVNLIPSPVYLEDTLKFIYFLLAAFVAVIMGVGVGFLANRRTMVTSLIIANVCIAMGAIQI